MNWNSIVWMLLAPLAAAFFLLVLLIRSRRAQPPRATSATMRSVWLVAASSSATVLLFVAAKVAEVIPHATAIDVTALAVTGILTGFFLAIGLTQTGTRRAG